MLISLSTYSGARIKFFGARIKVFNLPGANGY